MAGLFDFDQSSIPGLLGGLGTFLGNNSNALIGLGAGIAGGGTINQALSNGLQGLMTGRAADQKLALQNLGFSALLQQGFTPAQAVLAITNPEFAKSAAPATFPKQEFQNVEGVYGNFNPYGGKFTPQGEVPKTQVLDNGQILGTVNRTPLPTPGSTAPIIPNRVPTIPVAPPQPSAALPPPDVVATSQYSQPAVPKSQARLPSGFTQIAEGGPNKAIEVNTGTGTALVDPYTGQVRNVVPKDVQGEKAAEQRGTLGGQAAVALPDAIAKASQALNVLDQIQKHPAKEYAVGFLGKLPPIPGSQGYAFNQLVKQAQGQSFLQAYQDLKGAGAITEIEGQKATQAQSRLDTGLPGPDFDRALVELKTIIRNGIDRAKMKAAYGNGGVIPVAPVPQPPAGFVIQQ